MFRYLAENVTFILIKNTMLDIQDREIYVYGMETILMNVILLTFISAISFFYNGFIHLMCFYVFFLPLRMFAGGYHAKRSENCFVLTIVVYAVTLLIAKSWLNLYRNKIMILLSVVAGIVIICWAPLKNPHHLLSEKQYSRNKKIVYGIIICDFIIFIIFYKFNCLVASSELIIIILFFGVFLVEKIRNNKNGL